MAYILDKPAFDHIMDHLIRLAKNSVMDSISDSLKIKTTEQHHSDKVPIRLTADKLREIRWMSAKQIFTIYQGGKTKFVVDDSPDAYRELRWMDQDQLEALFGKSGDVNG